MARYDRIGVGYGNWRRPDPRIAEQFARALGGARTVLNVGAGAGSYEPTDRDVVAVEPSSVMIAQRPIDAAPVVQATADPLPFAADTFDAAMALLTIHHWPDPVAGLREMRRVTRGPILVFGFDLDAHAHQWLTTDYLPEAAALDRDVIGEAEVIEALGGGRVESVTVPADCTDGFMYAYWQRPEVYLDAGARQAISGIARLSDDVVLPAMAHLKDDLEDGSWMRRHGHLLELDEWDAGYRLVVAGG